MGKWMVFAAAVLSIAPAAAQGTQLDKTEIFIDNHRTDPVTMRFAIGFKAMTWKLIEQQISPGNDLSYRFPLNIPTCENMEKLGLKGVVTISTATSEVVCQQDIRLCHPTKWQNKLENVCEWSENVLARR